MHKSFKKGFILIIVFSFFQGSLFAQVDSVLFYMQKAKRFEYISFDSMAFYANKVKSYADNNGRNEGAGKYHSLLGVAYHNVGNYDSALYHHELALKLGASNSDSSLISAAYQHLGVVHKYKGNLDEALKYFFLAQDISERIGKYYTQAMSDLTIAQIYKAMGKQDESVPFLEEALKLGQLNEDGVVISAVNIEMGTSEVMLGHFDKALEHFFEAERGLKAAKNNDGMASIYNNIGAVYFYKGDLPKAVTYYLQSRDVALAADDFTNAGVAIMNAGEANIYLANFEKAEIYLQESLDLFRRAGNKAYIVDNYDYLHQLDLARKDHVSALQHFKLKAAYKDSILNERNLAVISKLKIEFESERKERENATLKAENELQSLKLTQRRNVIIGVVLLAFLGIASVLALSSRRRYKLRAELAKEREQLQKTRFKAVVDAEENERKRIARELHDGLGQLLSTARITVSSIDESKKVQNSVRLIDHAVQEVRNISHNMMPHALTLAGLDVALDDMVRKINESGEIIVTIKRDTDLDLDESSSIAIYRVMQEVLNNTLKYANAEQVSLEIKSVADHYSFSISDNGKGFEVAETHSKNGIGWSNVHARIELLGGEVHIFSKLAEGTTVKFTVPRHERANQTIAS